MDRMHGVDSGDDSSGDLFGAVYADIIEQAANIEESGGRLSDENGANNMKDRERIIMASKRARLRMDSVSAMEEETSPVRAAEKEEVLKRMTERLSARLKVGASLKGPAAPRRKGATRRKRQSPSRTGLDFDFI